VSSIITAIMLWQRKKEGEGFQNTGKTKSTIILLDKENCGYRCNKIADYLGADQPMLGHFELPKI
jgi:hypothetical protein